MEWYIRRDAEFEQLYNCSFYNVSDIPLEQRADVLYGSFSVAVASIEEVLYALCMISIWRQRAFSCYRMMFVMGCLDMSSLFVFGILSGWFQIHGDVYCSSPDLFYVSGSIFSGIWLAETSVEVALALNRCLFFATPHFAQKIFGSDESSSFRKTSIWLSVCVFYGFAYTIFGSPPIYSSLAKHFTWDVHMSYSKTKLYYKYDKRWFTAHQFVLACSLPIIYLIFVFSVSKQYFDPNATVVQLTHKQKMIFIQVAIIAALNSLTAAIMIVFSFFNDLLPPKFFEALLVAHYFMYTQCHGIPPVIYLLLNRSIRNDCRTIIQKLCRIYGQQPQISPNENHIELENQSGNC